MKTINKNSNILNLYNHSRILTGKIIPVALASFLVFSTGMNSNIVYAETPNNISQSTASLTTITTDTVGNTPIIRKYLSYSAEHRPGIEMSPKYITIHNTGNESVGADAEMHDVYLQGDTQEEYVSWHFTVDDHQIYQHLPINEIGYHAGDGGNGEGNTESIAIEICENADGNYRQAESNAEDLVAQLLFDLNMDVSQIQPHKHWSGKECPENLLNKLDGSVGWDQFIQNISNKLNALKEEARIAEATRTIGTQEYLQNASLPQKESIELKVGDKQEFVVYKTQPTNNYQLINGKDGLSVQEIEGQDNSSNKTTVQPGYELTYTQAALKASGDLPTFIKQNNIVYNSDTELFKILYEKYQDGLLEIEANEEFKKLDMVGASYIVFNDKTTNESIKFAVYNYINEVPGIFTKKDSALQVKSALDLLSNKEANYEWSIGDKSILSYDSQTGEFEALKEGKTKVSTVIDGITIECEVNVSKTSENAK